MASEETQDEGVEQMNDDVGVLSHVVCGAPLTWELGSVERPGASFCLVCGRPVARAEWSNPDAVLCVVAAEDIPGV